jgi:uncharacterized protein
MIQYSVRHYVRHFIIYVACILLFIIPHTLYADDSDKQTLISVSGSHSVTVKHDQATLKGSIITKNIKAQNAVQENAEIIKKIKDNLKQAQFDPKKLISYNYQLISNYDYVDNKQVFKNYQVSHDISITTDTMENIGIITDLLTTSGMNHISYIEFTSSNAKEAYDNALKNAVLDAKNKAERAISGIDNLSIGKALSIHINQTNQPIQPVMYQAMEAKRMVSSDAPTEFQTEGQKITVDVQTTWEIINQ